MPDNTKPQEVVIASNNPGKLSEIKQLLLSSAFKVIPQSDFNIPEIEETGTSFIENALLKAKNASHHARLPAIADDSGIVVDALHGEPGIYSARYAGKAASDEENLQKLIDNIKPIPEHQRDAHFVCVMVYLRYPNDPMPLIAQGVWDGIAITEPKGVNGFGYDPIFYLPTHHCTSAELQADTKNRLSHRGQALRSLLDNITQGQTIGPPR